MIWTKQLAAVALITCIATTGTSAFAVNQDDSFSVDTQESQTEIVPFKTYYSYSSKLSGTDFEKTFSCDGTYPWYKVWIRNNGSHDMKVDIDDDVQSATIKAGETKSYIYKTGIFSRNVTVSIWGNLGYDINGEIAIKTAENKSDFS